MKYPALSNFIENNSLFSNENLSILIDGNLRVNELKFQDFLPDSNLLFASLSEDSDCVAIDINGIKYLKLGNGQIWDIKEFENSVLN
jgi:hypothetical protein